MTPKQALPKLMKYCAYQERTHQEAREKLRELGVYGDDAEEIIVRLIEENFLNEERFAKAYAGGKFRLVRWGRQKIQHALKQKGLSEYCIRKGLAEIGEDEYRQALAHLLEKKLASLDDKNPLHLKQKLAQYAVGKGYETELVWETVQRMVEE